ncbi:N,N-dimethylformamidase beta subunit family domain-containing protein [Cryptosporangium sp. NPDC051539]|uniref:N,N-dimethylformamidase beta subunit family domain-containing protein n=1 Tax=Cryptosporangium sp. NPDC051539 TaxID=3363962 RepID=UPI0037ADD8B7
MNGLMGYTGVVSAEPGDVVDLFVSATGAEWTADLVRLYALEIPSAGVARREEPVTAVAPVTRPGLDQPSPIGSYVLVPPDPSDTADVALTLTFLPTAPGGTAQTVFGQRNEAGDQGWTFGLDEAGHAVLTVATSGGKATATTDVPLTAGCWYAVRATVSGGVAELTVTPAGTFENNRVVTGVVAPAPARTTLTGEPVRATDSPILWGAGYLADGRFPRDCFDGKIENPTLGTLRWDLAHGIGRAGFARPSHVEEANGRHGRAVNHPTRAVTGSTWAGDTMDFRYAPDEYAAIHFHRTDMTDCGWESQTTIALPDTLPSGVYAVRLVDSDGLEDRVPLIVRPPAGTTTADAVLVLPTNSYLAYANDHVGVDSPRTQVWDQAVQVLDPWWLYRDAHRELGLSMYESHSDGHGVCFSSWRRPILTLRATVYNHDGPVWQFTGDLQLIDWLQATGRTVDVVTDLDLHREGPDLLRRYRTVLTGTHPEYPSQEMLEAYETYVGEGGRLMYLGGNGMYWVTGFDPEDEQVIEIRRWGATQAWLAPPGEYHLSVTGRQGGIWRFRGRPPQKTFGVGFVAAGKTSGSAGYHRLLPADSPAAWIFAGVETADFGSYGTSGGAAGLEIDAVNPLHGTPETTFTLATSVGHTDDILEARENFNMTSRVLGGARNPKVHSDLVLVPRENGGGVFSVGSIAFAGALVNDDYTSEISTLLGTVFDRFVSGAPLLDQEP